MPDVATLLSEFVDALHAGEQPDAESFIKRADSDDARKELAGLIDQSLTLAPETATHPRDARGNFVSPVSPEQVSAIVEEALSPPRGWEVVIREWREAAGLSDEDLARETIEAGGFEPSAENVGIARRWIDEMQRGLLGARDISSAAMAAIASSLNTTIENLTWEGTEPSGGLALRADDDLNRVVFAHKISQVADVLGDAMAEEPAPPETPVDHWFAAH